MPPALASAPRPRPSNMPAPELSQRHAPGKTRQGSSLVHPPLGTCLCRRQTYPYVPANPFLLLTSRHRGDWQDHGRPQAPQGISTIAYEIRSSGQHRTAQIAGALRMRNCRLAPTSLLRASQGRADAAASRPQAACRRPRRRAAHRLLPRSWPVPAEPTAAGRGGSRWCPRRA
jgi:hypothetical protein